MTIRFVDRAEAGKALAEALLGYRSDAPVIYALPRGGVAVGYEIARALRAPLEIILTRKIGHPLNAEYAICAIAEGGEPLCNELERAELDDAWLAAACKRERATLAHRAALYRGDGARISARGRVAILVDDGIATGLTMRSAIAVLRGEEPKKLIVAAPVCPADVIAELHEAGADETVILEKGKPYLGAVGAYYREFPQLTDNEVIAALQGSRKTE